MPAFLPPQQMPYVQYPTPYQQFQAMPYQQFMQQGSQFLSAPAGPSQPQPVVAPPMQPGAVNAVRPKRKKKKQASIQQPVQALPQLSVQPMMAFNAPPQVPQLGLGGSAPPMAVP
jgi:hypothetical protein